LRYYLRIRVKKVAALHQVASWLVEGREEHKKMRDSFPGAAQY
jgi:hypothetical protein